MITPVPSVRVQSLHALAYCERLFYLEEVENVRLADAAVYAGRRLHVELERDEEGEWHTLELQSEQLGLRGRVDCLRRRDGSLIPYEAKRWRRAYRILRGYGRPLQYSLFRCRLGPAEVERLRWELERVLAAEDALLFVGLCSGCVERISARNRDGVWDRREGRFRFA